MRFPRLPYLLHLAPILSPLSFLPVALVLVLMAACNDNGSSRLREWTPADHGRSPNETNNTNQVAPNRADRRSPNSAPSSRTSPSEQAVRAIATLWQLRCASCHGTDGRGHGTSLPPGATPPDFTDLAWQQSATDTQIEETIRTGRGLMPPFRELIGPAGITALVDHMRQLGARR